MESRIRPLAICLFRHQGMILAARGYDEVKQQTFYRPLGGGIEFGETAREAIERELAEEIGAQVYDLEYLCTLENIFTFNGQPGHEIILVFDGKFVDEAWHSRPVFEGKEDNLESFVAEWKPVSDFGPGGEILYPDGLLEWLERTL
jgi:ADP-ribose pyrophosphatase YjhB (NUDIX family)